GMFVAFDCEGVRVLMRRRNVSVEWESAGEFRVRGGFWRGGAGGSGFGLGRRSGFRRWGCAGAWRRRRRFLRGRVGERRATSESHRAGRDEGERALQSLGGAGCAWSSRTW